MTASFRSVAAFAASVRSRLKAKATETGRAFNELEREFVMQTFLSRVFADPASPWILKGGTGLLVRLPGARYSVDLSLLNPTHSLDEAIEELQSLGRASPADPYVFVVHRAAVMQGGVAGSQVKVDVLLDRTLVARFPIDVSTELSLVGRTDRQAPLPIIEVPGLRPPPAVTLYPLPDQVADKVCAMYERHGPTRAVASTRYRDLVDLVFISTRCRLDAAPTRTALTVESDRRGLTLPSELHAPDPSWAANYPQVARRTSLTVEHHELTAALQLAGRCLNPLLADEAAGSWDPRELAWLPALQ